MATILTGFSMDRLDTRLYDRITRLLDTWSESGLPARASLHAAADDLIKWRVVNGIPGLWRNPPLMIGATLDDGWGYGIQLILKFAEALGCGTRFLGVLLPVDTIVDVCKKESPDIIGLTVLQLDTEDALTELRGRLPRNIRLIMGGPVFNIDPEMAQRVGIDFVAGNAAHFIRHMINAWP